MMNLPKNIVIVEDEVITQRYLQNFFIAHGITVSGCFDNAEDTLKNINTIECDMILMDINIQGGMDGIQLSREILLNHEIPIIFITAHTDENTVEELIELAPYGLIGKPFSSKELLVTLKISYKRYLSDLDNRKQSKSPIDIVQITKEYTYSVSLSELTYNGKRVKLNANQIKLLSLLMEQRNHIVKLDVLVEQIWYKSSVANSGLRTLVYSLRKTQPDLPIISHSKLGYSIETLK